MSNIRIKIDVTKISKDKLYKGEKGTYLNCTAIEVNNQYNDYMIVEETTKEEREAGVKGVILGSGTNVKPKEQPAHTAPVAPTYNPTDDLPF